jgi:hypothetical protein
MMQDAVLASWLKRAGLAGRRLAAEIVISSAATLCVTLAFSGWFSNDLQRQVREAPINGAAVAAVPAQATTVFRDMPSLAMLNLAGMPAPVAGTATPVGRATEGIHAGSAALPRNKSVRLAKTVRHDSLPVCAAPCVVGRTAAPSAPSAPSTDVFDGLDVPAGVPVNSDLGRTEWIWRLPTAQAPMTMLRSVSLAFEGAGSQIMGSISGLARKW